MSTAVMPQSAMYDFGDMFKSIPGVQGSESSVVGSQLAVGAAPLSPRRLRFALSRMSSSPAASLVTSLLDNLSSHQHQHPHKRLERTQSAPAPAASVSAAAAAAAVNTSRYKTELCRPYEEFGVCKYGDKCQFAHGLAELRSLARHPKYKTELCRTYHTVGFCPYGPRCHFVHNEEEARQHNRAVDALLAHRSNGGAGAAATGRPRPSALSPALSLDSPSPPSSLSQSPTNSLGSFFSSEPELHSPVLQQPSSHRDHHHQQQQQHHQQHQQQLQQLNCGVDSATSHSNNMHNNACPPSPSSDNGEFRLPVFNRLSASMLAFGDLML